MKAALFALCALLSSSTAMSARPFCDYPFCPRPEVADSCLAERHLNYCPRDELMPVPDIKY